MSIPLRRYTTLALLLLTLPALQVAAQESSGFALTLGGGYEAGSTTIDFPNGTIYQVIEFPKGTVSGYSLSIGTEIPLSGLIDGGSGKKLVLIPRVTFRRTEAAFVRNYPMAPEILPDYPGPMDRQMEFRLGFAVQDISLDLQMLYSIWSGLGLKAGYSLPYRRLSSWNLTRNMIYPAAIDRNIGWAVQEKGAVEAVDGVVAGRVSLLLQYDLPFGERLSVVPEFGVSRSVADSTPVTGASWSALSYGGGLSIRYLFGGDEPATTSMAAPTGLLSPESPSGSIPPDDSLPRPLPLTASIDLFTIDGDMRQQTMRLITTQHRRKQEVTLLPVVMFESDATTLSSRYSQIDPSAAPAFSLDSLARLEVDRVESHLLNVIGARLRRSPRETLRLVVPRTGGASGEARAESIRAYLSHVWQIAPSRLSIERSGDAVEKESVRLVGSREIFAPLTTEWIEQKAVASPLQIDPRIEGGIGPRSWTLTLRRGDLLIARHTSESREALSLDLALGAPAPGEIPAPLTVELSVSDSSGATAIARDTLEVVPVMGE